MTEEGQAEDLVAEEEALAEAAGELADEVIEEVVEEEVVEEASPPEPDEPQDDAPETEAPLDDNEPGEEEAEVAPDPPGIVTAASKELYAAMLRLFISKGSPRSFDFKGNQFSAYGEGDGYKFVQTGGQGSVSELYNSLSVG